MSPIPLVLCGKSPTLATTFTAAIATLGGNEYEVVHVIHTVASGLRELPPLLRGEVVADPETSITCQPGVKPVAVVVGKGYSEEEVRELREGVQGAKGVPWLLADDAKMTWTRIAKVAVSGGVALPGVVATRVVECLREHGVVAGWDAGGVEEGTVWGF